MASAAPVVSMRHDNSVLDGAFDVQPAILPETSFPEHSDCSKLAEDIIADVNKHLAAKDYSSLGALFSPCGQWRDHLAVSWDFRTVKGPDKIAAFLASSAQAGHQQLTSFAVDTSKPQYAPLQSSLDVFGKHPCVLLHTTFASSVGTGRGIVRLIHVDGLWKIYTFHTALHDLAGVEEPLGARRPLGASFGGNRSMKNWKEQREEDFAFTHDEPAVLIVGAGQCGLSLAACLRMFGVRTLVVDCEQRVGDNWRNRFRQLVLHDPVWYDHLPYLPFPTFWPAHSPKDKLGDFFEAYATLLELNVWTRTEVESLAYDADAKHYTATVRRTDSVTGAVEMRTFHPRHVVLATGQSGKKKMPALPGIDSFKGELLCHSSDFRGAKPLPTGQGESVRRAVVVGSSNSGHDIAQDLYENGYNVTLVQRSSTHIISAAAFRAVNVDPYYSESAQAQQPLRAAEDADLLLWSAPTDVMMALRVQALQIEVGMDAQLLQGLQKAGFVLDSGHHGTGLFFKYFQRAGGYYIDVGASQLIAEGKIKIKSGQAVSRVTEDGVELADGTHLSADVVVFATGYQNMRTKTRELFGDKLADQTRDVWGLDQEGELRSAWRSSGQPGYWYVGGGLGVARYYSRLLALQIKAQELGRMPYA
ncbi:hypothetical protein SEPCBS119000_006212 [Sporothrix epigloea]|uniref:Flavin-containing monooxygenase n=1 Tax=Sporothrix epigloea TaxID=1892477 RepID=A0ABP0E5X0_9PEZI